MTGASSGGDLEEKARTLAVIQARMTSTRLPGKTLRKIEGVPMLGILLDRLRPAPPGVELVVATSRDTTDAPVAEFCVAGGVTCVRGDLDDVLGRFVLAIDRFEPDILVRLTGDNPLVDTRALEAGLRAYKRDVSGTEADGVSNHLEDRTDPYGYCVEVVRPSAIRRLHASGPTAEECEHVTLGLRRRGHYHGFGILSGDQRSLRWTVDTAEDFCYVKALFSDLGLDCSAEAAVQWSRAHRHPSAGKD